ncbi:CD3337/EF1877 family mobilome membrane protein [Streptococcus agalactiae]|uniref:CD3337/EF1877 family mobilome membrane protein n=1 Tax=Streptococcus agalactiae TaxID=1311 RepID=UPI0006401400|nr:membrane protein [Streptococcus agalactiae]KLJ24800.1 membrane protein [Streptococcus agalactiae]KLJ40162.1 membrane protein [Streptococcus agalactiae]KLJ55458.1 membrane protein [Streptococcus agalactiae]
MTQKQKKFLHYSWITLLCVGVILLLLGTLGNAVQATGLVDETIDTSNEYSKYGLNHYQLDYYVDNSWGWLPWNWSDGIGQSVMYGLYAITNFIWTISLYLSNATGYLVKEAYALDFISQTSQAIGENMQTIAGITPNGFSSSGFYVGFLLLFILIVGIYVAYTGLVKRETTKAIRAVLNFVVVFILSASFIAYAPDYIAKINDFSKDVSTASLDIGTKIVLPDTDSQGKDSVDMIRDSLFSVQVKQPWLLLQYGSTDIETLGEDRVEKLLATSPDTNNGEDRENVVIEEIEDHDNTYLTLPKTISRLGTVFFLFVFNIGISIFVFLLTGIMIFSQVLFIIFAMFLPISFLLSMLPSFDGMGRHAITKLFNVIMTRAGITLIITVAFSISTMLYSLSASSPFFMIMFLQIVTFAGIYFKLGDLMSLFSLQSNDSQNMGRQVFRRPRQNERTTPKKETALSNVKKQQGGIGQRLGEKTAHVLDTKNRLVNKRKQAKQQIQATPTHVKYALHQGKENVTHNVTDFKQSMADTKAQRKQQRMNQQEQKRKNIAQKRLELDKAKEKRRKENPSSPVQNNQQHVRKRQQTVTPVLSQNTKRENHQRPLKKEQKQKTPPKQFNQRKLNKRTDKRGQQT